MNELYKYGQVRSSDLKRFLDRKIKTDLQNRYMNCFNEEFGDESPSVYKFEKWAKNLRFVRNDHVTPNDAQKIWEIISQNNQ